MCDWSLLFLQLFFPSLSELFLLPQVALKVTSNSFDCQMLLRDQCTRVISFNFASPASVVGLESYVMEVTSSGIPIILSIKMLINQLVGWQKMNHWLSLYNPVIILNTFPSKVHSKLLASHLEHRDSRKPVDNLHLPPLAGKHCEATLSWMVQVKIRWKK